MPRRRFLATGAAISLLLAACGAGEGDRPTVRVAAAASLSRVLEELSAQVEDVTGARLVVTTGGSSLLARQVVAGAPVDVLLTADEASMQIAGDADAVSLPAAFASNRAVVVVGRRVERVEAVQDLARPGLVVALCAQQAACGDVGDRVLRQAGVEVASPAREPDVNGVLTRVRLGEADAGIVYATDAAAAGAAVRVVDVAPPVTTTYYAAAVRTSGKRPSKSATDFLTYLGSQEAQAALRRAGFLPA